MTTLWKFLTSLRLTVVCLALGLLLVFFGTWAQVHDGLWEVQQRWFRSLLVWWGPQGASWKIPIFPGGYLLGTVLLVNLLAAHVKRFQWGWNKLGIHLTHGGIVLLLLGELFTAQFARESTMSLREGETKRYSESAREDELVFASDADGQQERVVSLPGEELASKKEITHPDLPFTVRVLRYQANSDLLPRGEVTQAVTTLMTALGTMESQYAAPEGLPAQAERAVESEGRLQVWRAALGAVGEKSSEDVVAAAKKLAADPQKGPKLADELKRRFRETMLQRFVSQPKMTERPTTALFAQAHVAERLLAGESVTPEAFPVLASNEAAKETVAFDLPTSAEMDKRNIAYAVLELVTGGKSLGTWLVSPTLSPVPVDAGGKVFRMAYRFERYYQPFAVTLLKTTHEVYPGTATAANPAGIPKNFQSRVRIDNPEENAHREVDIFMNNPLNYKGLKFFQYQMGSAEAASGSYIGTSTFQVVKNPSSNFNYIGCIIVGLGLCFQFGYHLVRFVNKRRSAKGSLRATRPGPARPAGETASVH